MGYCLPFTSMKKELCLNLFLYIILFIFGLSSSFHTNGFASMKKVIPSLFLSFIFIFILCFWLLSSLRINGKIVIPSRQWIKYLSLLCVAIYINGKNICLSLSFLFLFSSFFWLLSSLRINRKNYLSSRQWKKSLSLSLCLPKEDCLPFTSMEKFSLHFFYFFFKLVSSLHINKKNISFFRFLLFLAIVFPSQ